MSRASMVIFSAILVAAAWGYAPSADAASARADTASAPVATAESFSTDWSRARKISDVAMFELAIAVDSRGHVHVVGSDPNGYTPLYYLTNASGRWVQSEIAHAPNRGAFNRLGVTVDVDDSVWITYTRWSVWNPCDFMGCPPPDERSRRDGTYLVNNASGAWSRPRDIPRGVTRLRWGFAVHDGRVHFAYDKYIGNSDFSIWYASDASGRWVAQELGRGFRPYLALGSNGDPWIAYNAARSGSTLVVAHSRGPGLPFSKSRAPYGVEGGFGLDTAGRPVVIFDSEEENHGQRVLWTYWMRLDVSGWTVPRRLFSGEWATAFAVDSYDRMHLLYHESDEEGDFRDDGLYYGTSTGRLADTLRIDRSLRGGGDGPAAPELLAVDAAGRPHVVLAIPWGDNRLGLWYLVGPIQD